jgi:hypothetical protein
MKQKIYDETKVNTLEKARNKDKETRKGSKEKEISSGHIVTRCCFGVTNKQLFFV